SLTRSACYILSHMSTLVLRQPVVVTSSPPMVAAASRRRAAEAEIVAFHLVQCSGRPDICRGAGYAGSADTTRAGRWRAATAAPATVLPDSLSVTLEDPPHSLLQIRAGLERPQVHAERDHRLRHLGPDAHQHRARAEQPHRLRH